MLALMESAYVLSGQALYKTACLFWGRIFAVNFVLGVATRLTLAFEFGMNGSYFSHYAGDAFALPLAIEAISSFFLASILFGPFLFGWERLGKRSHLLITWLITLAVNASAVWVLTANGWMQNPIGAEFNFQSFRMELIDFTQLLNNPPAVAKAIHTIAACHATTAATVLAISAWLLLKNPQDQLAIKSYMPAAVLGLAATLAVWLVDPMPNIQHPIQIRKYDTLAGIDNSPLLPGIEWRIRNGIKAYALLEELRDDNKDPQLLANFKILKTDLGYALLLKRWTEHVVDANSKQIALAAKSALPSQPASLYWTYRLMIACGIFTLLLFLIVIGRGLVKKAQQPWLLKLCCYLLPLPWLAYIGGWYISEAGIQPWAIAEILPTFLSTSSLSVWDLIFSLAGYTIAYAVLLAVGGYLIRQSILAHLSARSLGVGQ